MLRTIKTFCMTVKMVPENRRVGSTLCPRCFDSVVVALFDPPWRLLVVAASRLGRIVPVGVASRNFHVARPLAGQIDLIEQRNLPDLVGACLECKQVSNIRAPAVVAKVQFVPQLPTGSRYKPRPSAARIEAVGAVGIGDYTPRAPFARTAVDPAGHLVAGS
jgi:hypothetical protein